MCNNLKEKIMRINKFIKGIMMALCLVALSVAYVGCEPAKQQINRLLVDDASILTVEQGTTLEQFEIVVKGMYPDSTEISISKDDLTITGWETETVGQKTLTISYQIPDTDTVLTLNDVTLTVVKKIESISYKAGSTEQKVEKGNALDLTNLQIVVTYADATHDEIAYDSRKMQVSLDTSTVGPVTMTISYMGKTTTTQITVIDVASIAYNPGSMSTTAYQYFDLDTTGASITVTYTDDSTKQVNSGLTFTGVNVKQAGSQNLKIGYKGLQTADIAITVLGLTNIDYLSGLPDSVNQGSILVTSNLKLTGTYEGGSNKTIEYNTVKEELAFTGYNTNTAGDQTVTITLGTLTTSHNFTVITNNGRVLGFQAPDFVSRQVTLNTYDDADSTGQKGFAEIDHTYVVGNQNEWSFMPKVRVYVDGQQKEPDTVHTTVKLYLGTTVNEANRVADADVAQYVDIDNFNYQTYKFTAAAAEQGEFTFTVEPYENTDPDYVIPFTIKVVNGYNVYNTKDFSILDNQDGNTSDDHNASGKWTTWRNANNVEYYGGLTPNDVSTIVLQGDLDIRAQDVPAEQFWDKDSEGGDITLEYANAHPNEIDKSTYNYFKGSVKDRMNTYNYASGDVYSEFVYTRKVDSGTFTIEGNYYRLSIENYPRVQYITADGSVFHGGEDGKGTPITTHATMFSFQGKDAPNQNMSTYFVMRDINLMGNAGRTENVEDSGGLLGIKKKNAQMTIENILSQKWFINFMNDEGCHTGSTYNSEAWGYQNSLNLKKVNVFDSFNTLIYNWSGALNIEDSHIIGAGGPVMICDHVGNNEITGAGGTISKVTVKNSVLQSWVAGTEGWFVAYGATALATVIKATNYSYLSISDNTKAILKTNNQGIQLMNLIAVYKSAEAEDITTSQIRGTFNVYGYAQGLDIENGPGRALASIAQDIQLRRVAEKIAAIVININNVNTITETSIVDEIMNEVATIKATGETEMSTILGQAVGSALAPVLAANIEAKTVELMEGDYANVTTYMAQASQTITSQLVTLLDGVLTSLLGNSKTQALASVQIAIMMQTFQGEIEDAIVDCMKTRDSTATEPIAEDIANGVKNVIDTMVSLIPDEIWCNLLGVDASLLSFVKPEATKSLYIEILQTVCASQINEVAQQIATANNRTEPNDDDKDNAAKTVVAQMLSIMYGDTINAADVDLSNKIVNNGLTVLVGAVCLAGQASLTDEDMEELTVASANTQEMQTYNGGYCRPGQDKISFDYPTDQTQLETVKGLFKSATGYTNLYLFNGMATVFGLIDVA